MSANYSDPVPNAGNSEALKPEEARQPHGISAHGNAPLDPQPVFREFVSPGPWSTLPATPHPGAPQMGVPALSPPSATPRPIYPYQPVYPGQVPGAWQPGQPGMPVPPYPGYAPYAGYPAYGAYPGYGQSAWPAQPKREGYALVVAIIAIICSSLTILGGLASVFFAILIYSEQFFTTASLPSSSIFAGVIFFITFTLVGVVGGGFGLYHSIRALSPSRPSKPIWLPRFWIPLLCYLVTLGIGFWLYTQGQQFTSWPLTGLMVYLTGLLPALTVLALGMRCLSFPLWPFGRARNTSEPRTWPTTWRRMTLALLSGATLSITLAFVLELVFLLILIGSQGISYFQYAQLDTNNSSIILIVTATVVAPLVEEMVKPLAAVVLIGRVQSKVEAFALGLACGIGFNLVETSGYISQGYGDWLNTALIRSSTGLLHGFGAAMVALGWYILTHKEEGLWWKRLLVALGCMGYAILQHALWNGTTALIFLPGPLGTFFQTWSWSAGPVSLSGTDLVNIAEVVPMLIFFICMAVLLRRRQQRRAAQQAQNEQFPASIPLARV